jgi:hypothetical protein
MLGMIYTNNCDQIVSCTACKESGVILTRTQNTERKSGVGGETFFSLQPKNLAETR